MHTVELLEQALAVAAQLGYQVRHEWLGGIEGGACHFGGQKWLFVDLSLDATEQLEQVLRALEQESALDQAEIPPALAHLLGQKRKKAA